MGEDALSFGDALKCLSIEEKKKTLRCFFYPNLQFWTTVGTVRRLTPGDVQHHFFMPPNLCVVLNEETKKNVKHDVQFFSSSTNDVWCHFETLAPFCGRFVECGVEVIENSCI